MDKFFTVAQVIAPIFVSVFLGVLARKKQILKHEEVQGMQNFVIKFCLPCVLFNSCLTANVGADSLGVMGLVLVCVFLASIWSYRARKKQFPYHNLPMMFSSQETGMLGIPLFMILFGAAEAYRMGILDVIQAVIAFPTIAILTAKLGEKPSPAQIAKNVLTSPLLIISMIGLLLNLTGLGKVLDEIGVGGMITASTGFLTQPVSAVMIFSVGYNFSISRENRKPIFQLTLIHFLVFGIFGALVQLALFLVPGVDALTRWSVLMYFTLPASYLAPGLGRSKEDTAVGSGVCSLLTVVSLLVFCIIAIVAA